MKQYKAKTIFGEPGVDNKLLKALPQNINLTLQPLDSLESRLDPQRYFQAINLCF